MPEPLARSVALAQPQALVIGSDQVAELDGVAYGKPGNDPALLSWLETLPTRKMLQYGSVRVLLVHSTPWSPRGSYAYPGSPLLRRFGDTDADITSCVGLFMEHDDLPKQQQLTCWQGILPPPTLQVDTGGKSIHQYWVCDEHLDTDRWRALTKMMIQVFNSDSSICNPSRVMRLPGYQHFDRKGNPGGICSIVNDTHPKYSFEELESALRAALPKVPAVCHEQKWSKQSSNSDWEAARPCPICGRDLDDKCRISTDGAFIQCHVGDTFAPLC
jgi:hypothetical protein